MPGMNGRPAPGRGAGESGVITVAAYAALFLLGLLQGLIGTFQYSRGPVPLAAILFDLAILVTCMLGARGMRTALGGVLPALGWFAVTLLLSSGSAGGSVFITDSTAGKWFLFGGAVCAAAGAVYAFARWSKSSRDRRPGQGGRAGSAPGSRLTGRAGRLAGSDPGTGSAQRNGQAAKGGGSPRQRNGSPGP